MRAANRSIAILWVGCALVTIVASAQTAEVDPTLAAARQKFLREMKSKSPEARVEAVAAFAKVPSPEAVEVLLKRGLQESAPAVRTAVRRALRDMGSDPATHK